MCDLKVTWAVLPNGQKDALPLCDLHLGGCLSMLTKRDGPTSFAFGYVGEQDFKQAKCIGDVRTVGVTLQLSSEVLTMSDGPSKTPAVKSEVSVEVR